MDDILAEAAARSITYLRERDARPVFPEASSIEGLNRFVEALPEAGTPAAEVLQLLDEAGSPGTTSTTGGRYFGFVTGASHPVSVGAAWLSAAWDQNAAVGVMSPTAGVIDTVAGAWLTRLFGLPSEAQHQFVTGTSAANALCLAVARDRLLFDLGWDSPNDGVFGAPPLRVVVSEAAHSSVTKALGYVGFGRQSVITVPADEQGRMISSELPEAGPPTLVIAQAGNVNSGAHDPFDDIATHFADTPHWMHIDGAFGLWAATSPRRRYLVKGIDRAHSWATDMHKWLNTTYDSAVAIVRDRNDMARSFDVSAAYLPESSRIEPVSRGIDMSQRAKAIEAWAVIKTLGASGVADLTDRFCDHATALAEMLRDGGLVIHNDVTLNQILVSLDTDEATDALLTAVQGGGVVWCSGSTWQGRSVLRISVCSWATTADDIDLTARTILDLARL
ncbi:MAG: glutamate/tyrosine decarboxylase-like PLP-dependent enzyme [Verrucomicrobiales bacterium]|jgi:glutamate/tyrosine decarboxylase-like PLP-dependent enzyme